MTLQEVTEEGTCAATDEHVQVTKLGGLTGLVVAQHMISTSSCRSEHSPSYSDHNSSNDHKGGFDLELFLIEVIESD